jgi:uncharacterized membrane protein
MIATFYVAAHAHDYVRIQAAPADEPQEEKRDIVKRTAPAGRKRASVAKPAKTSGAGLEQASEAKPKPPAQVRAKSAPEAKPENPAAEVSERQAAVLKGLRSLMDKKNRVEVRVAELAKASSVPLGSLHSILQSLEKKHLIKTERQGSPKFSAIYEVLETSRKGTPALNGAVHSKAA